LAAIVTGSRRGADGVTGDRPDVSHADGFKQAQTTPNDPANALAYDSLQKS
jgi:hypothetical protein